MLDSEKDHFSELTCGVRQTGVQSYVTYRARDDTDGAVGEGHRVVLPISIHHEDDSRTRPLLNPERFVLILKTTTALIVIRVEALIYVKLYFIL